MQQRFRVELLVNTQRQPVENISIQEVITNDADDAMAIAVRLLQKEYPTASWVKIDPWHVETI